MGLEFLIPRGVLLTGPPGVGKTFAVKSAVEYVRNIPTSGNGRGFQVSYSSNSATEVMAVLAIAERIFFVPFVPRTSLAPHTPRDAGEPSEPPANVLTSSVLPQS